MVVSKHELTTAVWQNGSAAIDRIFLFFNSHLCQLANRNKQHKKLTGCQVYERNI